MKNVIIFCANGLGELVLNSLDEDEVNVVAFADNDPQKWGGQWAGVKVIPPAEVIKENFDRIVISYSEYAIDIKKQLQGFGVDVEKISVFQEKTRDFGFYENRIALMRKCATTILEKNIAGSAAEVGVFRGDFSRLINRYLPDRKIYLFDTFDGFDVKDFNTEFLSEEQRRAFRETSEDYVLARMPFPQNCVVKKGYFPTTAEGVDETFCFVSLDADLYNPIKAGLNYFYPRLEQGGFIFVHDYGTCDWSGTKKAVDEFCKENNVSFFPLLDRSLSAVFVK